MAYAQAILPLAQQGGIDPNDALLKLATIMKEREKGTPVHEAVLKAFKPKEQPNAAAAVDPLAALMGGGGQQGGAPAPSQPGASQAPQGMDMMSLLAGLTGQGEATMSARTQRQAAI